MQIRSEYNHNCLKMPCWFFSFVSPLSWLVPLSLALLQETFLLLFLVGWCLRCCWIPWKQKCRDTKQCPEALLCEQINCRVTGVYLAFYMHSTGCTIARFSNKSGIEIYQTFSMNLSKLIGSIFVNVYFRQGLNVYYWVNQRLDRQWPAKG